MVKNVLSGLMLALTLAGCTHVSMVKMTPDDQAGLNKALSFPLRFTVPKDQAGEAWGRAQSFVGRFSSMKLQNATDYVIQTYNPVGSNVAWGYQITRTPLGDRHQFDVVVVQGNPLSGSDGSTNAHIAALYIGTGEMACERCIAQ